MPISGLRIKFRHNKSTVASIVNFFRPNAVESLSLRAPPLCTKGGSVAEWLACRRVRDQIKSQSRETLSDNSLRQTVHTHRASVHQAAKLVAALLRVAGLLQALRKVMAAYRRVYDSRYLQADCREPGSAPEPYTRYRVWATFTFFALWARAT